MWPDDFFTAEYYGPAYWDGVAVAFAAPYWQAVEVFTTDATALMNAVEVL